ncbi:DUF2274 domain-containing protein [Rhodoligotrophos defluvii]|uniref:DUF2274 domain-containing protein n=1 Tax=Rhodoligotrophos defluvii TaxID=2561934 RepID=UPI0010C9CCC2|nr:DUF2274 domain-containing protein [Rhodoligotrophos defluvii]
MPQEPLKDELDQYAAEHSRLYEPVDTAALIPHMLEAFVRSDCGWRSRKAKAGQAVLVNEGRLQRAVRLRALPKTVAPPEAVLVANVPLPYQDLTQGNRYEHETCDRLDRTREGGNEAGARL